MDRGVDAMNEKTRQVMHECSKASLEGGMAFPEVVSKLTAVGCEQYHADLRRQEKTYYLPGGESHSEALPVGPRPVAQDFSAEGVLAALRAIQGGRISYREFLARIMEAGCVGYFVYLAGKRAVYLGRKGDMHVEHFPPAGATADD
jgi:uncharacterized protein YbcV (DUF1398 family)